MRPPPPAPFLLCCFSLIASAQTATLLDSDPSRGTGLPPSSAATTDDATAPAINPAGLSMVDGPELFYLHERAVARSQVADGLHLAEGFGPLSLGLGADWVRNASGVNYRKVGWTLAGGGRAFSIGASFNFFSSWEAAALDGMSSVDLGLLVRPVSFLSLGAAVINIDQPIRYGLTLGRRYDVSVGVRPLTERLALATDLVFSEAGGLSAGRLAYTVRAELIKGLWIDAGLSHGFSSATPLLLQLGLTLDGRQLGVTYAGGGGAMGLDHIVAIRASGRSYRALNPFGGKVILVNLHDALTTSESAALSLLGVEEEDPFLKLQRFFHAAAVDPEVSGVVVKIDRLSGVGMGKLAELREMIFDFKGKGKPVIAVLLGADDPEYFLATSADRILALPESELSLNGLLASATFLGGAMEKVGVHWDVARVGAYKNAPDALTRSQISPEQREAISGYLDADVRALERSVERARGLSKDKLWAALDEGISSPRRAKELALIDEVVAYDQLDDRLKALFPGSRLVGSYPYRNRRETGWGEKAKIAIIPVIGDITGGKSRRDPLGSQPIAGAQTVMRALKAAQEDFTVKAIVLRVDSPGGDVLASDLIYRAVLSAKRDKPVVASMGDLAASGGYYAAMGADEIVASPTTITGSIGVFILKPSVEKLAQKLGVNHEAMPRGKLAGIFDLFTPWTPEEQSAAQRWADEAYDGFISEVSAARKLPKPRVDEIAKGRVWAGEDAARLGLVDRLGGFDLAITQAKARAMLSPDQDVELEEYGEPHGLLASGGEEGLALSRVSVPSAELEPIGELAKQLGIAPHRLTGSPVQAVIPFVLTVR